MDKLTKCRPRGCGCQPAEVPLCLLPFPQRSVCLFAEKAREKEATAKPRVHASALVFLHELFLATVVPLFIMHHWEITTSQTTIVQVASTTYASSNTSTIEVSFPALHSLRHFLSLACNETPDNAAMITDVMKSRKRRKRRN